MGYILIEESLFKKMMAQLLLDQDIVQSHFSEEDYWITAKQACEYLNISKAMLNVYRRSNLISYCKIGETYRYKRADVYTLKTQMDKELIESGKLLNCRAVVNSEEEAINTLTESLTGLNF